MTCTLVLGGARSGKSRYAERLAQNISEQQRLPVVYVATSEVTDDEMKVRIDRHRRGRPEIWGTIEEPVDVAEVLLSRIAQKSVVLVDCLSLLLNNWMFYEAISDEAFFTRLNRLETAIKQSQHVIIIVSNEVGSGIVPEHALVRQYRDYLGWMNQAVANLSNSVILLVAGIPVDVRKIQVKL